MAKKDTYLALLRRGIDETTAQILSDGGIKIGDLKKLDSETLVNNYGIKQEVANSVLDAVKSGPRSSSRQRFLADVLSDDQKKRVRLLEQDVRKKNRPQVDVLAAQNFSFWIFKTRAEVIDYFKMARANIKSDGIMVMDMMGGGDCQIEGHVDKRVIKKGKRGFRYYWKQDSYNPINHDASFSISFKFKDGSWIKRAFEYHWRFWSIAEVREMLAEAGFKESHVYWETEDEDGEDTGEFERRDSVPSAPCWIAYIVAVR